VALSVTLLVGAGLLLRTFQELGRVSPGFDPSHILTFRISGNWGETADLKKLTQRIDHTLDQLRATPGVRAAATPATAPGLGGAWAGEFTIAEGRANGDGKIVAEGRYVSDGYFAAMRIPLLAGEPCHASVDYGKVVVNRAFANAYFGSSPVLGRHLQPAANPFGVPPGPILGMVGDARERRLTINPCPLFTGVSARLTRRRSFSSAPKPNQWLWLNVTPPKLGVDTQPDRSLPSEQSRRC